MLTFQILDGGVTFFVPLEGKPLTIGSDSACDVRLTEAGVAPLHARVEPVAGSEECYKLVDLAAGGGVEAMEGHGPTRVNGTDIAQVRLTLGDRVEIGCAVLVLGRKVQRQNTAADVLEQMPGLERTKRSRQPAADPGQTRLFAYVVVGALLATALYLVFALGSDLTPSPLLTSAERLRRTGDFERAAQALQRAETDWSGGDAARAAMVEAARGALQATKDAVERTRERVIAALPTETYAGLLEALREEEQQESGALSEAARIVRSELPELHRQFLAQQRGVVSDQEMQEPDPGDRVAVEPGARPGAGAPTPADPVPSQEDPLAHEVDLVLEQVDSFATAGEYGKAYELIVQGMASYPAKHALRLRERLDVLRAPLRAAVDELVGSARQLAAAGDLDAAVQSLRDPVGRFPSTGEFAGVYNELARMQAELDARRLGPTQVAQKPRPDLGTTELSAGTIGSVAQLLDQVRRAEISCDFALAAELLHSGAEATKERDPLFSRSLAGRAADFEHLLAFELDLGARLQARAVEVDLRGQRARFHGASDHRLQVAGVEGELRLALLDVPLPTLAALVEQAGLSPAARLGFAVLAYRQGDPELAEAQLLRAWNGEAALAVAIQDVIRRGRTEPPDPKGYVVVRGRFVSQREIAAEKLAKELESKVAQALAGSEANRAKILEGILAGGPDSLDALLLALKRRQQVIVDRVDRHPFRKTVARFAGMRAELDAARMHAKELIYDEKTYFYPFAPPVVDREKARLYWPVQLEVDRRVSVLRDLWKAKDVARVPKSLLDDAAQLDWIHEVLTGFGSADPAVEAKTAWVRALPDGGELTLQNFSSDLVEKELMKHWNDIETYNNRKAGLMSDAERTQVRVTNEYRRMFHHRPLAVHPAILRSARGHSEEMSRLGYFGHFSPVAGRRTPFDRMRLEGYFAGVAENCAVNDSAVAAHNAWLRSAGHHRNLLSPGHSEFGVGNDGRYWTQNFGHGTDYKKDPDFPGS